jgi:hypothetical protein
MPGGQPMKKTDKQAEGCVNAGCFVALSMFLFSFLVPAVGITVFLPLLSIAGLDRNAQELDLATQLYLYGFLGISCFESARLAWARKQPAPTGYQELSGGFDKEWSSRLDEAAGLLLDAVSAEEAQANQGCNHGCGLSMVFAGISLAVCVNARPGDPGLVALMLAIALVGLLLWANFFRRLHHMQSLDHWLKFDFAAGNVEWLQRRRGKPPLHNESLATPKLVVKNGSLNTSVMMLVHSQGQEIMLTSVIRDQAQELVQFASRLAERTRLPFEDLRED